jgi:hypothetical protein
MYFLGKNLIIGNMYNKGVTLIITRKKLSFRKHFICPIQEFLEIKCKYFTILNNQISIFHKSIYIYTIIVNEKE